MLGREQREGLRVGDRTALPADLELERPPAWIGQGCELGDGVCLVGPVAIGDGCHIGAGAALRDVILLPGTVVPPSEIVIGAIVGRAGLVDSLRPLD